VREDQGIKGFADLKGKRIATTTGTTAHVFLDTALRANGVDPKDVELLNQRMPDAVTSFISGAVPAVALWVPFNITVRDKVPGAKKLVDAGAFYPKAAIVGGWAARNDYYEQNREVCARLVKGWVEANDYFIANPDAALTSLQKNNYSQVPIGDLREQYAAQKMFTSAEWKKLYADGTVTTWLQQVTDFFASVANIPSPVPASTYFDPKLFLSTAGA
jgi:NitT/TauT family transport system substrate-binding protein